MANILEIEIRAKDLVSNALGGWLPQWTKTLKNLPDVASKAPKLGGDPKAQGEAIGKQLGAGVKKGASQQLSGFDVGSFVKANFVMRGIDTLLGAVAAIPGYISNSLGSAVEAENSAIGAASSLSRSLSISMEAAKDTVSSMQESIAGIAADLPGTTEDYSSILTSIMSSTARVLKDDADMFETVTTDMVKRVGLMSAETHYDPFMTSNAVNKLIAGQSTLKQVLAMDIFEKVPDFKIGMNKGMKELGLTSAQWQDATEKQRLAVVSYALQFATPESKINALKQTASAIIEGWKSALFDPQVGVFGVRNEVESRDNRTVFEAYSVLLKSLDGLKNSIVPLLAKLGIGDPMAPLIDLFDWLSAVTNSVKSVIDKGSGFSLGNMGETIAGFITGTAIPAVTGLINKTWELTANALSRLDWFGIGQSFGDVISAVPGWLGKWLMGLNYSEVARAFLTFLGGAIKLFSGIVLKVLENSIVAAMDGIGDAIKWVASKVWDNIQTIGGLFNPAKFMSNVQNVLDFASNLKSAFGKVIEALNEVIGWILGFKATETRTVKGADGQVIQRSATDAEDYSKKRLENAEAKKAGKPLPHPDLDKTEDPETKPLSQPLAQPTTTNQTIQNTATNQTTTSSTTVNQTNNINAQGMTPDGLAGAMASWYEQEQQATLTSPK